MLPIVTVHAGEMMEPPINTSRGTELAGRIKGGKCAETGRRGEPVNKEINALIKPFVIASP